METKKTVLSRNAEPQLGRIDSAELGLGVPLAGWRSRGYLPHRDVAGLRQTITFRLADALPRETLAQLEERLALMPQHARQDERHRQMDGWLDAGYGCCALRHPAVATVMVETLRTFDGDCYRLLAWCVMPNHVHVVIEPSASLGRIVQSWKSYTGRWMMGRNAELELGVPGKVCWMREYWDRFIRDEGHFERCVNYLHRNPVTAGLCQRPEDWPWSSAAEWGNTGPQLERIDPAELGLGVP